MDQMDHGLIESPTPATARIDAIDAVRGFALLGILGPNMLSFGWPDEVMWTHKAIGMLNAALGAGPAHPSANRVGEFLVWVLFSGKMMFLFGLLFGAGVVLYGRKFDGRAGGTGLWYRRMGWLLAIGLAHGIGLWYGDILVFYAVIGMGVLWWVRRWRAGVLLGVGAGVFIGASVLFAAIMYLASRSYPSSFESIQNSTIESVLAHRGGYLSALYERLGRVAMMYFLVLPFFFWVGSGIMLMGMGLMKSGFLSGSLPKRVYGWTAGAGLTGGFALTILTIRAVEASGTATPGFLMQGLAQLVGVPTAIGYAALVILLVKTGRARWVTGPLSAVGRMALSNYLLQTIVCTTLFNGYGLGLYARVEYAGMAGIMAGVWCLNIALSLAWARFFRFGPAEWAWRCLTYWRVLPILRGDGPG